MIAYSPVDLRISYALSLALRCEASSKVSIPYPIALSAYLYRSRQIRRHSVSFFCLGHRISFHLIRVSPILRSAVDLPYASVWRLDLSSSDPVFIDLQFWIFSSFCSSHHNLNSASVR